MKEVARGRGEDGLLEVAAKGGLELDEGLVRTLLEAGDRSRALASRGPAATADSLDLVPPLSTDVDLINIIVAPHVDHTVQVRAFSLSTIGGANILYALQHDSYWSTTLDQLDDNPFLHCWSLGVEEQFYLVVGALTVVLAAGRSLRRWLVVFGSLGIVSIAATLLLHDPLEWGASARGLRHKLYKDLASAIKAAFDERHPPQDNLATTGVCVGCSAA